MRITCEECGWRFDAQRSTRRFCSRACQRSAYKRENSSAIKSYDHWHKISADFKSRRALLKQIKRNEIIAFIEGREDDAARAARQRICYLCGDLLVLNSEAYIDHDHSCCPTKKYCQACVRGIACWSCNILIGHAKDDPERLRRIASNLEKAKESTCRRPIT